MEKRNFNETYRDRTKKLAVNIIRFYGAINKTDEFRIIGKQLIRSATSVAANFRAACRARSEAEYYSKLCIVVEETDETLFWLDLLEEADLVKKSQLNTLQTETLEILKIFSKTRKTAKLKRK